MNSKVRTLLIITLFQLMLFNQNALPSNNDQTNGPLQGGVQQFEQSGDIWQRLNTRLIRGDCQSTENIPSPLTAAMDKNNILLKSTAQSSQLKGKVKSSQSTGNVQSSELKGSAQTNKLESSLSSQTNGARLDLVMDNCPPIEPVERPRWLILHDEMKPKSPLLEEWHNVRDRVSKYLSDSWIKQANDIGTGKVFIHFVVFPTRHISYIELVGNYWGVRSFAKNAIAFIKSFDGNQIFRFPIDSNAPDIHFNVWLENGVWKNLPLHYADEDLPTAERMAKSQKFFKQFKDMTIWLEQIGWPYI